MIIKFLLKIWPALVPIILYLIWILVIKKNLQKSAKEKIIDAEYSEINPIQTAPSKAGDFSLKNLQFIKIIYLTLILLIVCFLFFAIKTPRIENGEYIPARSDGNKIIPGKIIE